MGLKNKYSADLDSTESKSALYLYVWFCEGLGDTRRQTEQPIATEDPGREATARERSVGFFGRGEVAWFDVGDVVLDGVGHYARKVGVTAQEAGRDWLIYTSDAADD